MDITHQRRNNHDSAGWQRHRQDDGLLPLVATHELQQISMVCNCTVLLVRTINRPTRTLRMLSVLSVAHAGRSTGKAN